MKLFRTFLLLGILPVCAHAQVLAINNGTNVAMTVSNNLVVAWNGQGETSLNFFTISGQPVFWQLRPNTNTLGTNALTAAWINATWTQVVVSAAGVTSSINAWNTLTPLITNSGTYSPLMQGSVSCGAGFNSSIVMSSPAPASVIFNATY